MARNPEGFGLTIKLPTLSCRALLGVAGDRRSAAPGALEPVTDDQYR